MRFPEDLEELLEGDLAGLVDNADDFGVIRSTGADFVIGRVHGETTGVAHLT